MIRVMFQLIVLGGLLLTILVLWAVSVRLLVVIRRYRYQETDTPNETLPTVSVCIPARNETHAMTNCLERVLASDYERLEIIVLDDSSVDDTSVLIKSFAQEGVRFVEGSPLPEGWLGKNHALEGLLSEASGRYILYLDVDTILRPASISRLVSSMLESETQFASVLPQRQDGLRASVFLGTLRYFWPLLFVMPGQTPTSGSCVLIDRNKLRESGGFTDTESNVEPENAIARRFQAIGAKVGFIISTPELGISYEKKWLSQVETSTRLLKPLFGSTFNALTVAIGLLEIIIWPLLGVLLWISGAPVLLLVLAIIAVLSSTVVSLIYFKAAWRYGWWLGALHWPYVAIQEAFLTVMSVIAHASGAVTWKGRPIKTSSKV